MKKRPNFEPVCKGMEQGSLWKDEENIVNESRKSTLRSIRKGSKYQSKEFWLSPGHKEEELQISEQKESEESTLPQALTRRPFPSSAVV